MDEFRSKVRQNLKSRQLIRRGERVLVAVSGGLDSMVMLTVLNDLAKEEKWRLVVAHFNHRLRGRSSQLDEELVSGSARRLGLRFERGEGEVRTRVEQSGQSIEMAARELRHKFLAETCKRLRIRKVALAHHGDDQVEHFFVRLLRGAGPDGLAGMRWIGPSPANASIQIVRPMLNCSRKELAEFAAQQRIRFRQDASNDDLDFLRNRIRHRLIPLLKKEYQPGLDACVLRLMEIAAEESDFLDSAAEEYRRRSAGIEFPRKPVAIQRRILREELIRWGIAPSFELIERLRLGGPQGTMVQPGVMAFVQTDGRVIAARTADLSFQRSQQFLEVSGRKGECAFDGIEIRWARLPSAGRRPQLRRTQREYFDADKVGPRILLRHWREGDRFQPIGMKSAVKLQDWFTNRKVPRERRRSLVVAEGAGGKIFWVEGERIAERFKIHRHTTACLEWTWRRS